jgi:uncharacterized surface protein with fasciclin (FAS1) repeats
MKKASTPVKPGEKRSKLLKRTANWKKNGSFFTREYSYSDYKVTDANRSNIIINASNGVLYDFICEGDIQFEQYGKDL